MSTLRSRKFANLIQKYVGDHYYSTSLSELSESFSHLSSSERQGLLRACCSVASSSADSFTRSLIADVLMGTYPESLPVMEELLLKSRGRHMSDVRFTFFFTYSFMDDLPPNFRDDAERIMTQYLMSVRTNAGRAAGMAANCLGDYWPISRSLPILIHICREARYAEGRAKAAIGLKDIGARTRSSANRRKIASTLENAASKDRSDHVRTSARLALWSIRRMGSKQ